MTQHDLEVEYDKSRAALRGAEERFKAAQLELDEHHEWVKKTKIRLQAKLLQLQVLSQGDV